MNDRKVKTHYIYIYILHALGMNRRHGTALAPATDPGHPVAPRANPGASPGWSSFRSVEGSVDGRCLDQGLDITNSCKRRTNGRPSYELSETEDRAQSQGYS